ncbi:MAG TPA: hypothetical protein DEF41_04995 [Desulfovibrio sp.]|uniref:Uncharacterized protein n=1 Tax=Nitratidesulfovibrio vulgaris (strain ATCC 29579 / DSM 644 / CCUG 34227 / NCIMB 8303 / VKM B-1760 / Hildenborough) TaxID=882 RepID=Q72AS1_NITV2|nr:hypothetical protein DVU_1920 [Nitratidesulfovibrio vulgaris str. Hildenborough]HBW15490.1 hypothetical protein [Desulfovibrio sp.]
MRIKPRPAPAAYALRTYHCGSMVDGVYPIDNDYFDTENNSL